MITEIKKGDRNCKVHDWRYNQEFKVTTLLPLVCERQRYCTWCGRVEQVEMEQTLISGQSFLYVPEEAFSDGNSKIVIKDFE